MGKGMDFGFPSMSLYAAGWGVCTVERAEEQKSEKTVMIFDRRGIDSHRLGWLPRSGFHKRAGSQLEEKFGAPL